MRLILKFFVNLLRSILIIMMFLLLIFNEKEWNYNCPLMKEIRLNFDGERSCYYQILFGTREDSQSQRILFYLRVRQPFT